MSAKNQLYTELPATLLKYNFASDKFIQEISKFADRNAIAVQNYIVGKHRRGKSTSLVGKSKTSLTRKEKRQLGILRKCPTSGWNYSELEGLRTLWQTYMRDYLNLNGSVPKVTDTNWSNFSVLISRADFHGAELSVVRSKCSSLVDISGTCVLETKDTFGVVSSDNKYRTLPKHNSVFQFTLDNARFTIFGKHILTRPADRTSKKIKTLLTPRL